MWNYIGEEGDLKLKRLKYKHDRIFGTHRANLSTI